jgi:uncharacterized protein
MDAEWVRLTSLPRPPDGAHAGRWRARSLEPSISAAHADLRQTATCGQVVAAWLRRPGTRELDVLVGGSPSCPFLVGDGAADVPVLFPPGAMGDRTDAAADWLQAFPYWMRCLGCTVESGSEDAYPGQDDDRPDTAFEDHVGHIGGPFAWLVVAQPVPADELGAELARMNAHMTMLRKRENSESARLQLERGQATYRELSRSRGPGTWQVHVLIGGPTPVETRRAAALLSGAGGLLDMSLSLVPGDRVGDATAVWACTDITPDEPSSPFLASTRQVAGLVRGPARELPGIRLLAPNRFDVTPEPERERGSGVPLARIVDDSLAEVSDLVVSHETLNRHVFICGATGSGKSQTGRQLLEQLARGHPPVHWLAVEPAKAEYSRMAARLGPDVQVLAIRPGDLDSPPASLNPLEPAAGFPLQSHADLVRALFLAAFEANEPFPQVLSQALVRCYTDAGWDLVASRPRPSSKPRLYLDDPAQPVSRRYPTLGELQSAARTVVDSVGYGKEVAADVRGFIDVRIGSLRQGAPGRFFEGGHPLDIAALLQTHAVLELESITNDQDKAFLMGAVLIRIVEHLRVRQEHDSAPGLRHVLLIEEAHRLLRNVETGPAAAAVELFASLLAEIRAYGEGVVVLEQIPSKIVPDVLKNTALKVMHRLPAADDREVVGATMNLQPDQSEVMVAVPPGLAAASVDGADRPVLIRVPPGMSREHGGTCHVVPEFTGRRSRWCGPECVGSACRLAEINEADALAADAGVTVWVEAVAAALVIGLRPPGPRPVVAARLALPDRERDCALATVTGRAVDARRPRLRRWVDPDDFGDRLRASLVEQLAGGSGAPNDPLRWQAGYFRFLREWLALESEAERVGHQAPPYVEAAEWRRRGLYLDGQTIGEQLLTMSTHPSVGKGTKRVVFGDVQRSGLSAALIDLTGTDAPGSARHAFDYSCQGGQLAALTSSLTELLEA